jgi:hypothetical protein
VADLVRARELAAPESRLAAVCSKGRRIALCVAYTRGVWVGRFGSVSVDLRAHRTMRKATHSGWKRCLDLLAAQRVTTHRIEQV